ncbi:MAG: helix-turn-helix transcriptional regulator [Clostridium sp.]|nr:helix-turn-helix transcriptional regulator [Clostridium sp.]
MFFKDAMILWKNRRLRRGKGAALYPRLFAFFAFFILALVLCFLLILSVSGVSRSGEHKSRVWFQNELEHFTQDLSADYGILSVQGVSLSEQLTKDIEGYLKEEGISPAALPDHPEVLEGLLTEQMPILLSELKMNKCGGAFLILDATVIGEDEAGPRRAGLFLKRTEPNAVRTVGSKLHFLRGPAEAARANGVELLGQWQMEFTEAETEFFDVTVDTARDHGNLPLSRLYYWSPRTMLSGNSEAGMLLCVPLVAGDGTVLGVCGFEFSTMLFKQSYSPDNSTYTRVFSALAPFDGTDYHMDQGLLAGNTYLNSAMADSIARIEEKKGLLHLYHESRGAAYNGLHQNVTLYPADSPYRDSVWLAAVMAPHEDVQAIAQEGMWGLRLALGALALTSLLVAAFISRRYISPVLKTLEGIKTGGGYASLPKTQYAEINDLLEFLAAQDEATAAALAEAKTAAKPEPVRRRAAGIDPENYRQFLERLETLTPAERRVFDLYLLDKKAQEIADELNLSLSTVKYHNGNIYGKLEVGSRKELLAYIRYMRSQQRKKEGEHG